MHSLDIKMFDIQFPTKWHILSCAISHSLSHCVGYVLVDRSHILRVRLCPHVSIKTVITRIRPLHLEFQLLPLWPLLSSTHSQCISHLSSAYCGADKTCTRSPTIGHLRWLNSTTYHHHHHHPHMYRVLLLLHPQMNIFHSDDFLNNFTDPLHAQCYCLKLPNANLSKPARK